MPTEAELLADLLDGTLDAAEVPAELAELASLAEQVSQHVTLVPPTDAFRESLREQVLESAGGATGTGGTGDGGSTGGATGSASGSSASGATGTTTATGGGLAGGLGSGLSTIIAGVTATAVLATGTVAVADRAGPGDLLAGLDRGVESVQLILAGDEREAELLVDFAAERVLEAVGLVDTAVVTDQLQRAQALVERALALGVEQGRDLQELVEPYVAALLTLASRTDDPVVQAQVQQLLEQVGLDLDTVTAPGADGDEPPLGDSEGTGDTADSADTADTGTTDQLDDTVDDTTDQLDDTVDDTTDQLDDTVDDTTDQLDDTVDDTTEQLDDTVDDTTGELDDLLEEPLNDLGDAGDELVEDTEELLDTDDGLLGN